MLKKNVKYKNFDDEEVEETFYFHLSQVELLRWEAQLQATGGLGEHFKDVMNSGDGARIMKFMEDLIGRSIGIPGPGGKGFLKENGSVAEDFRSSLAYDNFFMGLVTNPDSAADFMNGIVPKELTETVERMSKLEQVKANVERRHPSDNAAKRAPESPHLQAAPEPENVSDPSEGGNVFDGSEKKRVITEEEMREMPAEELKNKLASGQYILGYE